MIIRKVNPNSELYHHGIKGQRWGVRRYQNSDGSLTAAGQKRYYKNNFKEIKNTNKVKYTSTTTYVHDWNGEKLVRSKLSDSTYNQYKKAYKKYNEKSKKIDDMDYKEYEKHGAKAYADFMVANKELSDAGKKAANEILGKYAKKTMDNSTKYHKKTGEDYVSRLLSDYYTDTEVVYKGLTDEEIDKMYNKNN